MLKFGNDWDKLLQEEFSKDYYLRLRSFLQQEYRQTTVFPPAVEIYAALRVTSFQATKVVLLGQDPYHGDGQAHGFAFSVPVLVPLPPSLRNILQELQADLRCEPPNHGCLEAWAKQGVLLLNAVLTVRANAAASHAERGWEQFTDRVVELLNEKPQPVVFLLWGNYAQTKGRLVTNPHHLVLRAPHPSPLSAHRGFFGCRHFSRANTFLEATNQTPITW
ncbi:MAG: Uracil-DNA glycosylase [Firmicutes bacterium]|nr:Uracil-DNA glycosylase [candidate division NPL-UPA2 bacterium]